MPLRKGGTARQYRTVTETLAFLRAIDRDLRSTGDGDPQVAELIRSGQRLQAELLAHVHREVSPATHPDLLSVTRDLQAWNAAWQSLLTRIMASDEEAAANG